MKKTLYAKTITSVAFLLVGFCAFAQTGTIKGRVITQDGRPVEYISVVLKETSQGARTNEQGEYQIRRVKAGSYTLRVSAVGLTTQEKKVTINGAEVLVVDFSLTENNQRLQEVTIKGTRNKYNTDNPSSSLRLNEPLAEIPQNVQIIGQGVLADQQIISMADGITRNVSGLTRLSHWADLYSRVNTRGARMASFRNGVNVTSSWGPLSEDMSFVDHIEFVKGPAGFLMSNGEPSGIYNVVTKKPTGNDFNGEASFMLGSYDLYRGTLDLDGKADKSGKVLYRLNLMGQNKNSFRNYEYNDRYAVAPVLSFKLDNKTTITLEYTYQYAKMSDVGSVYSFSPNGYATLPRNFTTADPGIEPTKINDHSAFLNIQRQLNTQWKVTAQLSYFNYKQIGANQWPSQVNADGTMVRSVGIWDASSKYKFGQLFLNGDIKTGEISHRILTGLDLGAKDYLADWNQTHLLDSAARPFNPYATSYQAPENGYPVWDRTTPLKERAGVGGTISENYTGLYFQDELGFWENTVRLTLAGRYTYAKQTNYGTPEDAKRFTPRVGLSVSFDQSTSAYALFDQSFVPQTGFLRNGGSIKPITGNNIEFGAKRDWFDGRWSTSLSIYRILKNNELTSDPENDGTEPSFSVVLGQSRAQGIEFDLRGEILQGLNVIANYAYTDSKVNSVNAGINAINAGDRIPGYAKHNLNTWLNYKVQKGVLTGSGLSAGFSYQIDRDSWTWGGRDGIPNLPNYFRLDGGAFWEKGKVKLTANVFNILDKYLYDGGYEDWTSPSYYSWQVQAPRNYRVSMAYKF